MQRKGSSIFQKLLLAFSTLILFSLVISGVVHYQSKKKFIGRTIQSHLSDSVHASIDYFGKTFAVPIETDLHFIEASPLLDNYLTSRKDEAFLTKPLVERMFLFFTKSPEGIYLSARFIDAKGKEKLITAGRQRVKAYATLEQFPGDAVYRRVFSLFKKLRTQPVRTILFEGPFKDENSRPTFVIGISKMDPEIGGFGGAVIFHCDLSVYLKYMAALKFQQAPIAYVSGPDNQVILSQPRNTFLGSAPELPREKSSPDDLAVSAAIRLGSHQDVLLNFTLSVPREVFTSAFKRALVSSALIGLSVFVFIVLVVFFLSMRLFINPIKELVEGTRRLGHGDLSHRINVKSRDEIAQLAEEFNRMAEGLEKTTVSRDALTQEITERKRAEEALKQSEARYRTLFDNAPVMDITTLNLDGKPIISDCNKLFADTLGYPREQLLQQPLANYYAPESVRQLLEGGGYERSLTVGILSEERKLMCRDGSVVDTMIRVLPEKDAAGEVCGTRVIYIDITQRKKVEKALKESEERFRALFEQASVGVAEVDTKTGRFIRINQKYCDIVGYSAAEMLATTYPKITHPDDLQADLAFVEQLGKGEIRIYSREKRYIRKDGTTVWINLTVSPIWEKGEQSARQIAVVEDISDRRQVEEERNQLILKLQGALAEVKTLSGLLPICSHCKKIRDDKGYWNQIESYIHKHSAAEFSHGICPECAKKYYSEYKLFGD